MLQYLTYPEIDPALWDACVESAAESLVYGTAGYLNVSTAHCWHAVVEVRNGRYVSVFPLPVKTRLGIPFIYQPLFIQQLGLFTTPESSQTFIADYLAKIPGHFRKVYLQLNTGNTFNLGSLPKGFAAVPRVTYHLELDKTYEQLRENYAKNLKRNLKKAREQQYEVETANDLTDLVGLYRVTVGQKQSDLKDRHYLQLRNLHSLLQQQGQTRLLEIRQAGELLAGALFLVREGRLIYLFSASSEAGKKSGAMALIIDSLIREKSGSDTILDFEGSVIPTLARFFGSFGGKPVTYLSVSRNNLPWYLKWLIK